MTFRTPLEDRMDLQTTADWVFRPRILKVPGIAEKRVAMIEKAWAAQKAIKDVMLFLRGHGVSTTRPAPPQLGQGRENENGPCATATAPEPPHWGQVIGFVPGAAPEP